ncbi:MAG: M20/M25/M40 family metallo-hydrolase [Oscillospiraceae bacterium]|nr:M20/M25/M40 family metallo-hydrolase [Oscillospiraceae bacterium]
MKTYIEQNSALLYQTLKELCAIPAPSHLEHKRAQYCKTWLENHGATGVYIDEALNVIFPINCQGSNEITVFAAHTDTVFPDTEPMPYHDDGEKIFCPGVADDTASVAILLLTAKYFVENNIVPKKGIMFVLNSCEEGLGNLKGTRQLFESFANRIKAFITLDSSLGKVVDCAVGSHRYEVHVATEGGHSFNKFGNRNAIAELSRIVSEIYKIQVPQKEGTKTTYNVGTIEGGTSVNTIAQSAKMLCEYRSNDKACLEFMKQRFAEIFKKAAETAEINVQMVGDRPCSDIDPAKIAALKAKILPIMEEVVGKETVCVSGSTDCNIPLSLGVPALCIGTDIHDKTHTRQEWLEKASLKPGLLVAIKTAIALTEECV